MGNAKNCTADCVREMDGNRSVYNVLRPQPSRVKKIPIVHIRRVKHGVEGSSTLRSIPAAESTSLAASFKGRLVSDADK